MSFPNTPVSMPVQLGYLCPLPSPSVSNFAAKTRTKKTRTSAHPERVTAFLSTFATPYSQFYFTSVHTVLRLRCFRTDKWASRMLRYEVLRVHGTQDVTFHADAQSITATFTRGDVRLLRRRSFKGNFFTPVIATNHVLLIFPNSCTPGAPRHSEACDHTDGSAASSSVAGSFVTSEAQACIGHFLESIGHIPYRVADAAACGFSGCAVLVLECQDMEDVLAVLQVCADVVLQGNASRTSNLFVKGFPCADGEPSTVDADLLSSYYYIPTCPVCGDRLESTVSGYAAQTPLCTCARGAHAGDCTCFLSSSCLVCRRFAESLEQARQSPQQQTIKCEACAKAGDPWICLICGYVGCSRYQAMHAKDHYVAQQHFFSMNLLTQQIWDYDGDCFVHRVVILLDMHTGSSTKMQFPGRDDPLLEDGASGGGSGGDLLSSGSPSGPADTLPGSSVEAWKAEKKSISAKYDKKLTSSHTQYAMVIKSELDAKRAFYEAQLVQEAGLDKNTDRKGEGGSRCNSDGDRDGDSDGETGFSSEEMEREACFELTKAFEPVDSILADLASKRRKTTAMCYAVKNLAHEQEMRAEETGRLEKQLDGLKKELRSVIQQNVASDLRLSSSIHDLQETLQDIALNAQTQRRLAAQLGGNGVSRMVVVGHPSGAPSSGSSAPAANRKKNDKTLSKGSKK